MEKIKSSGENAPWMMNFLASFSKENVAEHAEFVYGLFTETLKILKEHGILDAFADLVRCMIPCFSEEIIGRDFQNLVGNVYFSQERLVHAMKNIPSASMVVWSFLARIPKKLMESEFDLVFVWIKKVFDLFKTSGNVAAAQSFAQSVIMRYFWEKGIKMNVERFYTQFLELAVLANDVDCVKAVAYTMKKARWTTEDFRNINDVLDALDPINHEMVTLLSQSINR